MSTIFALQIHAGTDDGLLRTLFAGRSGGVHATRFEELGCEMLHKLAPQSVVSPLFSDHFDCVDVANCLSRAGFPGKFCILAEALPNADMVQRELKRQFPDLDLRVVSQGDALDAIIPRPRQANA